MCRAEHWAGTPAFLELPAMDLTDKQVSPTHRGLLAPSKTWHLRARQPGSHQRQREVTAEAGRRPHKKQVPQGSPQTGQKACLPRVPEDSN